MKLPAFQFYPGDWRKDPDLSRCSKAAKGVWIDMLALMFECPIRGVLADAGGRPWSDQEIAEAIGGPIGTNLECIAELLGKGVASRNNRGAIFSRRLVRDEETRQAATQRKQRSRASHTNVTPMSQPSSSSTSSSKPPPNPPPGENGDSALELTASDAGLTLCHLMGLTGYQMRQLAKGACESAKRRKADLSMTEIPVFVQSLWREYDGQSTHVKVSLRTFLGELGRFMDSDSWRKQDKTEIGRGYVPPPKAKGTGAS